MRERVAFESIPAPATPAASSGRVEQLWRRWRFPLLLFALWRLLFIPVAFLASNLAGRDLSRGDTFLFILPHPDPLIERTLGIWNHWDGQWFLLVAHNGYQPGAFSAPYFPLYPLLVRLAAWPLGGNLVVAGPLVATVFGLTTFILFYELVGYEFTPRIASRSLVSLAVYPVSFFLVACYSEGVFMSLMLGAFLAARRYRNWPVVGLLVGLASLSRNMGIWLMLPLGWEWAAQNWQLLPKVEGRSLWQRLNIPWRKLFSLPTLFFAGVPALCFGSFLLFEWAALGNPFQFVKDTVDAGWGRRTSWPWQTVGYIFGLFSPNRGTVPQDNSQIELVFLALTVLLWLAALYLTWQRRWPVTYLLVFTLALLLPLSAVNPDEPLISYPRYSLLAFPLFIVLGSLRGRARFLFYLYSVIAFLFLLLFFAVFANWSWVA